MLILESKQEPWHDSIAYNRIFEVLLVIQCNYEGAALESL